MKVSGLDFGLRKPYEMRQVGLSRLDYQLIGEIAVISGMLEQAMKEFIVRLVQAPWPDGMALTAHLNFGSICDMANSLLDSCLPDTSYVEQWRKEILAAKAAYDDRSELIHGPFAPFLATQKGIKKAIFRTMARGKIKYRGSTASTEYIEGARERLFTAWERLSGVMIAIEAQRAEASPYDAHPRNRAGFPPASG